MINLVHRLRGYEPGEDVEIRRRERFLSVG